VKTLRFAAAFLFLALPGLASAAVSFDSPRGRFRLQVQAEDAGGRELLPLAIIISPADGGAPMTMRVQVPGYKMPDDRRLREMFHFSPNETTVAIFNPRSLTISNFRVVPLVRRPWQETDLEAESVEWADDDRMVFRGLGVDNFYIGVLDVRTGKVVKANPALSMNTEFDIIQVTPKTIVFREEDASKAETCYSVDTRRGKRRKQDCPK